MSANAPEGPAVSVPDISPKDAWAMLRSDPRAVLLDVRSRVEFDYVGHPVGAVHVAWQEAPTWQVDPDFVQKVRARLSAHCAVPDPEEITVLALCRSGHRSAEAALALARSGFRRVYNVAEGFEGDRDGEKHRGNLGGWRFHGLPWEQT